MAHDVNLCSVWLQLPVCDGLLALSCLHVQFDFVFQELVTSPSPPESPPPLGDLKPELDVKPREHIQVCL